MISRNALLWFVLLGATKRRVRSSEQFPRRTTSAHEVFVTRLLGAESTRPAIVPLLVLEI
jgi:hypothetical protein